MSIVWPLTLPQKPSTEGFSESLPDQLIRTSMDTGPAKVRRRSMSGVRKLTLSYYLTADQVSILEDFFIEDIGGGSLAFDFPDPRTGDTISLRFVTVPKIDHISGDEYRVTFEAERLP